MIEKTRVRRGVRGNDLGDRCLPRRQPGLVIAEIELSSEDQAFAVPAWAIREVSDDSRYYNSNLISHPYSMWVKDP